ncbi:MAG: DsbA family protein, partial [Ideonella sp.]|nr:DsbA family protein [Ideonella sp.]
ALARPGRALARHRRRGRRRALTPPGLQEAPGDPGDNGGAEATRRVIFAEAGLPDDLHVRAAAPDTASRYAAHTQQALDAGVFGAPSDVVDGEIFWGQDRLDFLARWLHAGGGEAAVSRP